MKEERILSEKEADELYGSSIEIEELFESSIEKGIAVFSDIWDEFKDSEEFDVETIIVSVMTECAIFLRFREWTKKQIRENIDIGIEVADKTRKEMKKEESDA